MIQKKIIAFVILVVVTVCLGGCSGMSRAEEKAIVQKAEIASERFIKEHYDADFVLKNYEVVDPSVQSTIYLYGYIKGHEEDKITIVYSYQTNEVRNVIGPDWFIDSEKNKE